MSRSQYSDDYDDEDGRLSLYRANVDRCIAGKKGQKFLAELASTLDAMPEKILIADELVTHEGEACALGEVCKARKIDTSNVDYEEPSEVAKLLNIPRMLVAEIEYENDEGCWGSETPEGRWQRMRSWVAKNLKN